ncbi:MAG: aromatic ring-hydroxylating dioxygenase subunit alpha [Thermoleophilaceae bacterium]
MPTPELSELIQDDREGGIFRVHRSTMTSPEFLQLERERVFGRSWLYLGHESEVADPGDYRRRRLLGRSIMFLRSDDGEIRAFHNTCPHRGAIVCRRDQGNAKVFQCFYHAWTFNTRGELVGMPAKDGYGGSAFDKKERGLTPVPRLEGYRGFWFVSFWPGIMALDDWLAGAKEYIDLVCDQSLDGRMRVVEGTHHYSTRANWKLLAENSVDGYHGVPTHQTYVQYLLGAGGVELEEGRMLEGRAHSLGNGHAAIEYWAPQGRPVARWVPMMGDESKAEVEQVKGKLVERYGEERADRIGQLNRNILIYPNLVLNDLVSVIVRTFNPLEPDFMEITAWALAPEEEEGVRLQARLHNFLEFFGPGGLATPDDVEALESCQIGFNSGGEQWNDISRGMVREAQTDDELQMRTFWRQWAAQMQEQTRSDWDDAPVKVEAEAAS